MDARTKAVFGFPKDFELKNANGLKRMGALIHAKRMMSMLDSTITMLGPDLDTLTELFSKLGKRHESYGVLPSFFPLLGQSLINALAETLGPEAWSYDVEVAWNVVYDEMSRDIVDSMTSSSSDDEKTVCTTDDDQTIATTDGDRSRDGSGKQKRRASRRKRNLSTKSQNQVTVVSASESTDVIEV